MLMLEPASILTLESFRRLPPIVHKGNPGELQVSSRKVRHQERIEKLLDSLTAGDLLVVSELSRLGRSLGQVMKAAAHFLGVSPSLVYAYVERKQIPHYRMMGRSIRFRLSELVEWRQQFHVNGGIDEQDRYDLPVFFGPPITGEQRQSAWLSRSRVLLGQREPASPASAHRHPSQHGAAL